MQLHYLLVVIAVSHVSDVTVMSSLLFSSGQTAVTLSGAEAADVPEKEHRNATCVY